MDVRIMGTTTRTEGGQMTEKERLLHEIEIKLMGMSETEKQEMLSRLSENEEGAA
jgi:hypothetical protein